MIKFTISIVIVSSFVFDNNSLAQEKYNTNISLQQLSELKNPTFYDIKSVYDQYWSTRKEVKPGGWKQYKRWEYFWSSRLMPDSTFPNGDMLLNEYHNFQARSSAANNEKAKRSKVQASQWELVGPVQLPANYNGSRTQGLGRINVVRFDPSNSNVIWAGSATGGVWKSDDNGANWRTFDFTNFLSMGVSDIAIYPKNPSIVYVSTGDDDGTYGTGDNFYSIGLIKTFNGGTLWETTNLTKVLSDRSTISRVLVHPDDYNNVIVSTNSGIYKSIDGGKTWTAKLPNVIIKDMEFMVDDPNIINASSFSNSGSSRIYRSTDNGETWVQTQAVQGAVRIALTVSPSNINKVWAIASRVNTSSFHSFWVSTNRGESWQIFIDYSVSANILGRYDGVKGDSVEGQGPYDLCLAVDPSNEEIIYTGGINIWRSSDGGNSFRRITKWSGNENLPFVHADIHDLIYKPGTNTLYNGNDGGLYYSDNPLTSWKDITSGMSITQFYRMGLSSTDPELIIGGCQDNGTHMNTSNGWKHLQAGDGMECAINPNDNKSMFMTYYYGSLYRSTNSGQSFNYSIEARTVGESGGWVTPFVIDQSDPKVMYIGFQNVWKSTNSGVSNSWKKVSNFNGATLVALAIAPSNSDIIYAATATYLYASYDAGINWERIYTVNRFITYIAIDPVNPKRLWLTFGDFYSDSKIIELNDSVATNITGNLPNVPVNCVVYQKDSPDRLYIGTDIGVFYSDYNSAYWELYNEGMPNVIVNELEIYYPNNKLIAATYGRGMWRADLINCSIEPPTVKVTGVTEFCQGDSLLIEAQEGFNKYLWSNGDTNRVIRVKESGLFSVRIFNINGCHANSPAIKVTVLPTPDIKIITSLTNVGYCENSSVKLTASLGFSNYQWSDNSTGRIIQVSKEGIYWVKGYLNNGCISKSEDIEVKAFTNPVKPDISKTGNDLSVNTENEYIKSYQWYLNGEKIPGATNSTYHQKESGLFSVEITDTNGCSTISDQFQLELGVDEIQSDDYISIFPNPSDGMFTLKINNRSLRNVDIQITNLIGEIIFENTFIITSDSEGSYKINLQQQPAGLYLVKINTHDKLQFMRLIKE